MKRIFLLAFLASTAWAQNSRLNGIWVAPIEMAKGPNFFAYTFTVDGDKFTGSISDMGEPAKRFIDGKIENGQISFSVPKDERYYTGTLRDGGELDLIEELHYTGWKGVRRPGSSAPTNTFEGEWVLEGRGDLIAFHLHLEGEKVTGEIVDKKVTHQPIIDGSVHGDDISFRYINSAKTPMLWTAKRVGDHLDMISDLKRPLHAMRIGDNTTNFGGLPVHKEK